MHQSEIQELTALTDVPEIVDGIFQQARLAKATDVHLCPTASNLELKWRLDGVLHSVVKFRQELAAKVVARLKVLAGLLTYRTDVPQEGRIAGTESELEIRVSTFPTVHGEKAVLRFFGTVSEYESLDDLHFSIEGATQLRTWLTATSGVILLTGPAGSGKTTTIYACLREILNKSSASRSLVSLEDPVEIFVDGVDQSQVNLHAGFEMPAGLKALLRQDPDVIMVGEIRDAQTAQTVFQASLTGHLVLTTFHAGNCAEAISRLAEMEIEPYLLRSGLRGVCSQRLVRRLCECATPSEEPVRIFGEEISSLKSPAGCSACRETGYLGRILLTEQLVPDSPEVASAILAQSDSQTLHQISQAAGMNSLWDQAKSLIREGVTSAEEIFRVLGQPKIESDGLEAHE